MKFYIGHEVQLEGLESLIGRVADFYMKGATIPSKINEGWKTTLTARIVDGSLLPVVLINSTSFTVAAMFFPNQPSRIEFTYRNLRVGEEIAATVHLDLTGDRYIVSELQMRWRNQPAGDFIIAADLFRLWFEIMADGMTQTPDA